MNKIKIKQIPFGIASRVGNTIYINKDLEKYNKQLYEAILMHEYAHTEGFTIKDITLDIHNVQISGLKKEYYKFILTHPKSLIELIPIIKYDGQLQINTTLLFF